jgi:hypothetical protein
MTALAALPTTHRVSSGEDASSVNAMPVPLPMPNEPPSSFIILERSNGYASRPGDRKFNPLVLDEIQTQVTLQRFLDSVGIDACSAQANCSVHFEGVDVVGEAIQNGAGKPLGTEYVGSFV